jgi:uncharacterized UBP type Zn finger protein
MDFLLNQGIGSSGDLVESSAFDDINDAFPLEESKQNNVSSQQSEMLSNLVAMGFNEQESLNALRLSKNDFEQACEYLLNSDNQAHDLYS